MTTGGDYGGDVATLRRTLLLLAHNQHNRQQIEAAGRHIDALHRAITEQQKEMEMHTETEAGAETSARTAAYRVATLSGAAHRGATWTLRPGSHAEREQAEIAALVAMRQPGTLAVILDEVDGALRAPRWFRYREDAHGAGAKEGAEQEEAPADG